jgi:hypothetical protein
MSKSVVNRDDTTGDLEAGGSPVEVVAGPGIPGEYKRFSLSTAQLTNRLVGDQIEWDQMEGIGAGILLDTVTHVGRITLPEGGHYVLRSGVRYVGTDAASEHTTQWYDITNAVAIGNFGIVIVMPSTNPSNSSGVATAYVDTTLGAVEVELQTTNAVGANQFGVQSWAEVQRVDVSGSDVGIGRALHDTTHDPIALWQLGASLQDISGNGRTLTQVGAGEVSVGHVGLATSERGLGTAYLQRPADAGLQILGAVSGMCLVNKREAFSGSTNLIFQQGTDASGAEVDNVLYALYFQNRQLTYFHQYGAGNNELHSQAVANTRLNQHSWMHLGFTRAANGTDVIVYLNGEPVFVVPVVNAPTGGGSGNFDIAARASIPGGNALGGDIQSLKIVAAELTAADMKAEYERCFGVSKALISGGSAVSLHWGADCDLTPNSYPISNGGASDIDQATSNFPYQTVHVAPFDCIVRILTWTTASGTTGTVATLDVDNADSTAVWTLTGNIGQLDECTGAVTELAVPKGAKLALHITGTVPQNGTWSIVCERV